MNSTARIEFSMIKGWSDGRSLFIPRHRVSVASIPTCLQSRARHARCTSANLSRCLDRIDLEHVLDDCGDPEVEVAERNDRVYARVPVVVSVGRVSGDLDEPVPATSPVQTVPIVVGKDQFSWVDAPVVERETLRRVRRCSLFADQSGEHLVHQCFACVLPGRHHF